MTFHKIARALIFLMVLCFMPTTTAAAEERDQTQRNTKTKAKKGKKKAEQQLLGCETPLEAVLKTLQCVFDKDAACVASGYAPDFEFIHNDVPVPNFFGTSHTPEFWEYAFLLTSFDMEVLYVTEDVSAERYQASLRYIETVTTTIGSDGSTDYPFSQTFVQHEHTLVSLNSDCEIVEWNQYGDNAEQQAVYDGDLRPN